MQQNKSMFEGSKIIKLNQNINDEKEYDLFIQDSKITCSQSNTSFQYCSEKRCHAKGVVCIQQTCKCYNQHKKCSEFMRVQGLHQKINSKVITNTQQLMCEVEKQIDSITDIASLLKDQLQNELKIFGLNQSEQRLLNFIKNDSQYAENKKTNIFGKGINGGQVYQYRETTKQNQQNWFKQSLGKYKNIVNKTRKSIQPYFNQIQNILTYYDALNNPEKQIFRYFNDSSIVDDNQSTKFKNFLSYNFHQINTIQKIYSFDLLDDNKFQTDKFLNVLNGKQNLLFLVKNQYHKNFGVLNMSKFDIKNIIQKQSERTMLFSLDTYIAQNLTNRGFQLKINENLYKYQSANIQNNKPTEMEMEWIQISSRQINQYNDMSNINEKQKCISIQYTLLKYKWRKFTQQFEKMLLGQSAISLFLYVFRLKDQIQIIQIIQIIRLIIYRDQTTINQTIIKNISFYQQSFYSSNSKYIFTKQRLTRERFQKIKID